MGVPGLWDILRPAQTIQSLSSLARHAFHTTDLKALTVGIDASIWIFHAAIPQHGENPFMRTIFFKITSLLHQPVLPVFVFDGPKKPGYKRNQKVAGGFGTSDTRSRQFKELLDEMGLEWWNAPGEAEAELARMNRQGKIDAVLSDDVDALLFGAKCLIRNNSATLSQNKGKEKDSKRTYEIYRSDAIAKALCVKEDTSLRTEEDCRMAMVLIALLAGGDYVPEGLTAFGPVIALGLAHAGFAEILKSYISSPDSLESDLLTYHARMVEELRTNASGHIGRRYPDRANKLSSQAAANLFPTSALESYLNPFISSPGGPAEWPGFEKGERSIRRGKARNEGRGDLEGMARACERFFEWGTKDRVVRKFATETVGVYGMQLVDAARNAVRAQTRQGIAPLASSQGASNSKITSFFPEVRSSQTTGKSTFVSSQASSSLQPSCSTPDHIVQIHSTRLDPSDEEQTEYRISYEHAPYTARVRGAMTGDRVDPNDLDSAMKTAMGLVDRGNEEESPTAELKNEARVWMADYLVKGAWPDLVAKYEDGLRAKSAPKALKGRPAMKKTLSKKDSSKEDDVDSEAFRNFFSARPVAGSSQTHSAQATDSDSDIEVIENPAFIPALPTSKTRHHPTSSISSLSSLRSPTPPRLPSINTSRRVVRTRSKTSPQPRSTRSVKISTGTKLVSAQPSDVIDLCSSEEETPKASRTRVLSPSTGANVSTPRRENQRTTKASPKKSRASPPPQTRLDLPVLAPSSQSTISKSTVKPQTPRKAPKPKKKKYAYVVLSETSDEEILDMIERV